ncbi:hypothetical protein Hanom_Chr10g00872751 [Helianthus anomalus]
MLYNRTQQQMEIIEKINKNANKLEPNFVSLFDNNNIPHSVRTKSNSTQRKQLFS